jgi:hypothetical protein
MIGTQPPTIELWINDVPPSMNKIGGHSSHWRYQFHKKKWNDLIGYTLIAVHGRTPLIPTVRVTALLRFPTNRRRDEGNFRMMLEKAMGDILQSGGWLPDDTPDYYRFGEVTIEDEIGPNRTILFIEQEARL